MNDDRPPSPASRVGDYRTARIAAAGVLTGVTIALLLIDAASPAYEVSAVVVVALLSAILGLLGLEVRDQLKG